MVRYGEILKHVRRIVLSKPPRTRFKARDLAETIEKKVGYHVSAIRVGQSLSKLRESGLIEKLPDPNGGYVYDWILVGEVMKP